MSDRDRLLDHEYDGIREYDNRLPNWWLYTLYGAIIFAFGYWIYYHTLAVGNDMMQDHAVEAAEAARVQLERMGEGTITDETLALLADVPEKVVEGRKLFAQFCVVCHGQSGEGNVGPNLTDAYWIHGNQPTAIWNTVQNGVPDKGMAAWGNQLGPTRVQSLVAFVLTIRDTNVPGKQPEGERVTADGGG